MTRVPNKKCVLKGTLSLTLKIHPVLASAASEVHHYVSNRFAIFGSSLFSGRIHLWRYCNIAGIFVRAMA
jgi:hypothetical protein